MSREPQPVQGWFLPFGIRARGRPPNGAKGVRNPALSNPTELPAVKSAGRLACVIPRRPEVDAFEGRAVLQASFKDAGKDRQINIVGFHGVCS